MMEPTTDIDTPGIVQYLLDDAPWREARARLGKRSAAQAGPDEDRQRVLVVDDEDLIADTLAEILNRNGFDAVAQYSGAAALKYARENCPNIIVTDVIMPDCDGVQLAKSVRERCPGTRVILFSGNAATSGLLTNASDDGYFFELLSKPVHPAQLLKSLKS